MSQYDTINKIEAMTEREVLGLVPMSIAYKDHTVYLVDLGGYFGYSMLVFYKGAHLFHANNYALHYNGRSQAELRKIYMQGMSSKLFSQEDLDTVTGYSDYQRKEYYLRNYYSQREPYISIFRLSRDPEPDTDGMTYDPISFAWYADAGFVETHKQLMQRLEAARDASRDSFDYWLGAYKYEMYNHEYSINLTADWDTLSAFGGLTYMGDTHDYASELTSYFKQLGMSDTQRKAYLEARHQVLSSSEQ